MKKTQNPFRKLLQWFDEPGEVIPVVEADLKSFVGLKGMIDHLTTLVDGYSVLVRDIQSKYFMQRRQLMLLDSKVDELARRLAKRRRRR